MKVIVCSDSHGAFAAAEQLLEQQPKAAAVIFLGDGAEEWGDLHEIYPEIPFYPVRGNCDWGSDWPGERIVELGGHRIFCTHGRPGRRCWKSGRPRKTVISCCTGTPTSRASITSPGGIT